MPLRAAAVSLMAGSVSALNAQSPLRGKGIAQHPFLYSGAWQDRSTSQQTIYIARGGKIV